MGRDTPTSSCPSTSKGDRPPGNPGATNPSASSLSSSVPGVPGEGFRPGRRKPRRTGKAEPVGDILARILRKHGGGVYRPGKGAGRVHVGAEIRADLTELLGAERMERIEIRGFRAGQLTIGVRSAPLKHELESFYARKILDWLKNEKGRKQVRRIRFSHVA